MALRRFTIQTEFSEEELVKIRNGEAIELIPNGTPIEAPTAPLEPSGHTIRPEPIRQATTDPGGPLRISTGDLYRHMPGIWNAREYPVIAITGSPVVTGSGSGSRDRLQPTYLNPINARCRVITTSNVADSRYADCLVICGTTGARKIQYFVSHNKRIFSEHAFYLGLIVEYEDLNLYVPPALRDALRRAVADGDMFTYIRRA